MVRTILYFMYLLFTLVILLLPYKSILVIRFIHWHTEYLSFTTNSLIWSVCFHVPKYVCDNQFIVVMQLVTTDIDNHFILFYQSILKIPNLLPFIIHNGCFSCFYCFLVHLWPLVWCIFYVRHDVNIHVLMSLLFPFKCPHPHHFF